MRPIVKAIGLICILAHDFSTDCGIRYLQAINIADILLNIGRWHSLGIDLVLHILWNACLVLRQYLMLKIAVSVTRYININFPHACTQNFLAVNVTTVVCSFVLHIIRLISKFIVKLWFKASFDEFRYRFIEKFPDIIHTLHVSLIVSSISKAINLIPFSQSFK